MTVNDPIGNETFHFEMKTSDANLERFYDEFEGSALFHRMPPAHRLAVKLSFDELVSNVIKYSVPGEYQIKLLLSFHSVEGLRMVLKDNSPAFDPWNAPLNENLGNESKDTDLQDVEVGGRGLFMIRQLMDSLSHSVENGWNCNRMTMGIPTGS